MKISEWEFDFYGNFQLLKHPIIAPAIVSSRYSSEQRAAMEELWEETFRTQGVLVSPFISSQEKDLMKKGIEEGCSIIRIIPDGLSEKYKPQGKEFDLCMEGRCLHIGPPKISHAKHDVSRKECLAYNDLARWIASHPADIMHILDAKNKDK